MDIQEVVLDALASGVPLLTAFRKHRRLGVAELAAYAAVPAKDLADAEAGGSLSSLAAVADVLEVPAETLLWHSETVNTEAIVLRALVAHFRFTLAGRKRGRLQLAF